MRVIIKYKKPQKSSLTMDMPYSASLGLPQELLSMGVDKDYDVKFSEPISDDARNNDSTSLTMRTTDKDVHKKEYNLAIGDFNEYNLAIGDFNEDQLKKISELEYVEKIYSDCQIAPFSVCPNGVVGDFQDVQKLLNFTLLQEKGLSGSNVLVAVVDTGINRQHLTDRGLTNFNLDSPINTRTDDSIRGDHTTGHGTMSAFNILISAPNCTLSDHAAILQSSEQNQPLIVPLLSGIVKEYGEFIDYYLKSENENKQKSLVINNSWGIYSQDWDYPLDDERNYINNPKHLFNRQVASLEKLGPDVIFAAGNCGSQEYSDCKDSRCSHFGENTIYGANSHPSVLCVGAVTTKKQRLDYSSIGRGMLSENKPDLCAYAHFSGSQACGTIDSGTSTACAVVSGLVAAIRTKYPPNIVSPSELKNIIRNTCETSDLEGYRYDQDFDFRYGKGIINVKRIIEVLEERYPQVNQNLTGNALTTEFQTPNTNQSRSISNQNELNLKFSHTVESEINNASNIDININIKINK